MYGPEGNELIGAISGLLAIAPFWLLAMFLWSALGVDSYTDKPRIPLWLAYASTSLAMFAVAWIAVWLMWGDGSVLGIAGLSIFIAYISKPGN